MFNPLGKEVITATGGPHGHDLLGEQHPQTHWRFCFCSMVSKVFINLYSRAANPPPLPLPSENPKSGRTLEPLGRPGLRAGLGAHELSVLDGHQTHPARGGMDQHLLPLLQLGQISQGLRRSPACLFVLLGWVRLFCGVGGKPYVANMNQYLYYIYIRYTHVYIYIYMYILYYLAGYSLGITKNGPKTLFATTMPGPNTPNALWLTPRSERLVTLLIPPT